MKSDQTRLLKSIRFDVKYELLYLGRKMLAWENDGTLNGKGWGRPFRHAFNAILEFLYNEGIAKTEAEHFPAFVLLHQTFIAKVASSHQNFATSMNFSDIYQQLDGKYFLLAIFAVQKVDLATLG